MSEDRGLRNTLIASTLLHIGLLLLLYFGLPSLFKPLPPVPKSIPLEIVEISEMTNTRVQETPEEAAKPPEPQTKPTPPTPTPPQPQTPPTPPTPPKPLEPKTEPTPSEALLPKPAQKPKPPEPPKPEKPQQDQLASVLKNVAKLKPAEPKNDSKTPDKTPDKPTDKATTTAKSMAPTLSDRLTISEEDALRRQISQCWNIPAGAKDAQNLVVEVLIDVNPDRTVREAHVVDELRMASDRYFRSAAESALRALRNPKCNPLELNPDKYEQWKTIRFNFDPRDML